MYDFRGKTFTWPVPDYGEDCITSPFGPRTAPTAGASSYHNGIDIGGDYGATIIAACDGTVISSGPASGFGHWIRIDHGDGIVTIYGHMYADGLIAQEGSTVKAGEKIALAKAHGAGLSIDEFNKEFGKVLSEDEIKSLMEDKSFYPSYMWNVVGSLVDKLGLTLTSIKEEHIPVVCENKINSSTLNMDLEKGMVRGMNAVVIASTKEHIEIEVECIGKVYTNDEKDINSWTIYGEPTTSLVNESPCTVELTCADVVNRIPDVIEAKSGFITNNDLKEASFKFKL